MKKQYLMLLLLPLLPMSLLAQAPNDDCSGAISLTASDTICSPVTGDVTGNTESIPAITCNGFTGDADSDMWYSFVASGTDHNILVTGASDFDAVVELLEGTCGSQTSLDCADATLEGELEEIVATNLVAGNTYYVRVYDWYADAPSTPTFTICVITPPPPPPNDNMSPNNEGFEDGGVPACWTLLDEDGDGANWFVYSAAPHTGDSSMASASWNGAPLTPENYLILPQVTPGMDEHLTYWVAAQDPDYAAENYSVVVSTTGMAAADFTDELFTEVLASTTWEVREVDLSAYMGMDIYIAFKHFNVTDEFVFKIDDVQWPTETTPCVVGVNEFNNVSYNVNIFPNPSATDVNFQSEETIVSMDITDISGRLIKTLSVNNTQFVMDRDELNSGVYFVTLNFKAGSMTQKLIIE